MNQNVLALVITRFSTLYGEPNTSDPDAFMAEYSRALGGFPKQVLKAAIDRVVDAHEYLSWPPVGVCVAACKRQTPEPIQVYPDPLGGKILPPPTPEQRARCRALVAELKAKVGLHAMTELGASRLPSVDRDAWNARRR